MRGSHRGCGQMEERKREGLQEGEDEKRVATLKCVTQPHTTPITICALIFTGLNVSSICGSAAICERFVWKHLALNVYVPYNDHDYEFKKCEISEIRINPTKIKLHMTHHHHQKQATFTVTHTPLLCAHTHHHTNKLQYVCIHCPSVCKYLWTPHSAPLVESVDTGNSFQPSVKSKTLSMIERA